MLKITNFELKSKTTKIKSGHIYHM